MKYLPMNKKMVITEDIDLGSNGFFHKGAEGRPVGGLNDKISSIISFQKGKVTGIPDRALPVYDSGILESEEFKGKYKLEDI